MSPILDLPPTGLRHPPAHSVALPESRLLLDNITWQQYEGFLELLSNRHTPRLLYCHNTLELMTTSPEHERLKKRLARLLELYALEGNIALYSCGSPTYRREDTQRGIEPDESYCLDTPKAWPDLAIEVIITSGGIDRLDLYQGLGVREVWFWQNDRLQVYCLSQGSYQESDRSGLLPALDLSALAALVNTEDELQALRQWQRLLRDLT